MNFSVTLNGLPCMFEVYFVILFSVVLRVVGRARNTFVDEGSSLTSKLWAVILDFVV